jgi:hypothetical protein
MRNLRETLRRLEMLAGSECNPHEASLAAERAAAFRARIEAERKEVSARGEARKKREEAQLRTLWKRRTNRWKKDLLRAYPDLCRTTGDLLDNALRSAFEQGDRAGERRARAKHAEQMRWRRNRRR